MPALEQAFTIGFVLSAKDLYSATFAKARRDLDILAQHSADRAAQFERNLKMGKTLMYIGGTMTAYGYLAARVFEDFIAKAGESETVITHALTTIGDQAGITRAELERHFSRIKTTWGETDEAVASALIETGGRLGDYRRALTALDPVAALARARNLDLATSASLLTTLIATYGDEFKNARTESERFGAAANVLSGLLKTLGADSSGLTSQLGNIMVKARGAGVSLSSVLSIVAAAGRAGARLRLTSGQLEQLLDTLLEMRKYANFREVFPSYSRTGDFLDALSDLEHHLTKLPDQTAKLSYLRKLFGDNANTVLYFIETLKTLRDQKKTFEDLSNSGSETAQVFDDARKNMQTWSGVQKQFNAQILEFKEALGAGAIPMAEKFLKSLGDLTQLVQRDKFLRSIFIGGFTIAGLITELSKIAGPIITAVGLWRLYHVQQDLAILKQTQLNALTAANVPAAGAGARLLGAAGAGAASTAGAIAAGITLAPLAGYAGWKLGEATARYTIKKGLPVFPWEIPGYLSSRKRSPEVEKIIRQLPPVGPVHFETSPSRPPVTWNGNINLQVFLDGKPIAATVKKQIQSDLNFDSRRQP
ncbi:MAG: phage tail tape measure protein [candidate division WOR-3 bacterium]|nr:phage tail tape measure protein [candidate division WOR-3 bacterium]